MLYIDTEKRSLFMRIDSPYRVDLTGLQVVPVPAWPLSEQEPKQKQLEPKQKLWLELRMRIGK